MRQKRLWQATHSQGPLQAWPRRWCRQLGNVDNTSDAAKPASSATQTALDTEAPLAIHAFTGTVTDVTKAMVQLGNDDNTSESAKPVSSATQTVLDAKARLASPASTGEVRLTKPSVVGTTTADSVVATSVQADTLTARTAEQMTVNDGLTVTGALTCDIITKRSASEVTVTGDLAVTGTFLADVIRSSEAL